MPQRGPARASDPAPDAVRRTTLLLALLLATIAGSVALLRARALPPVVVWTLRAADSAGHESLTVHATPGGDALAGRWILVEEEAPSESHDGRRVPAVVLVRLRLHSADRHEGSDTAARILGGGEVLYRPWPDPRATPDAMWHAWRRAGL